MAEQQTLVIADLLRRSRRQAFVGRRAELDFLRTVLGAPKWPFHLLSVVGPAGIGKTTFLREAAYLCEDVGVPSHWVDLDVPGRGTLTGRIREALADEAGSGIARHVLILDGLGSLVSGEAQALPELFQAIPASWLVIVSSRDPMPAAWETDPAWRGLHRALHLEPLSQKESLANLSQLQVPHLRQPAIAERAAGVPLVHSLAASYCTGRVACCEAECEVHELVHALAGSLADAAPTPLHRRALYAAALLTRTTEDILGAMLEVRDAHRVHAWLALQGFAVAGRMGLRLTRPYRQSLEADLRWRNPSLHRDLVDRGMTYALDRLRTQRSWGTAEEQLLLNVFHLRRFDPLPGLSFPWEPDADLVATGLEAGDALHLETMVRAFEGPAEAKRLEAWLERRPEAFIVLRDRQGIPMGFLLLAVFWSAEDLAAFRDDPVIDVVARQKPFDSGSGPLPVFRSWMSSESHQAPDATQPRLFAAAARRLRDLPPPIAVVATLQDPAAHEALVVGLGFHLVPGAEDIEPKAFWRAGRIPIIDRLLRLLEAGTDEVLDAETDASVDLDPIAFEQAVRQALKDFTAPDQLRRSPLLDTTLVRTRAGPGASRADRVEALRHELVAAAESLAESPRRRKAYEALRATYLEPEPNQEAAAEAIEMAFSTYRRYLGRGIRWVAEVLRARAAG